MKTFPGFSIFWFTCFAILSTMWFCKHGHEDIIFSKVCIFIDFHGRCVVVEMEFVSSRYALSK